MRINRLKAAQRLVISLAIAIAGYYIAALFIINRSSEMMAAWVLFCISLLLLDWITFFTTTPEHIRQQAQTQDESAIAIFIIILLSIIASITGVFVIVVNRDHDAVLPLILGSCGMAVSWAVMHTIFAIRYAHLYYGDWENKNTIDKKSNAGLQFPNADEKPDFIDFAYFSFVIGMTFQVSDIEICHKRIRRLVLLHSVISFAFNTLIVALAINVIAGFSGK